MPNRPSGRQSPTPNFDRLARVYRWMEYLSFGPMLERCRFWYIPACAASRYALILGDGDGRFTASLLGTNPELKADAVDGSAAMLAALKCLVGQTAKDFRAESGSLRLNTFKADIREFVPPGNAYDLVVTHFFLDCLAAEEIDGLIKRILPHLNSNAVWLVSEFAIPEHGWRKMAAKGLIRGLYFAFSVMTRLQVNQLPDYASIFARHNFQRAHQTRFLGGLLVAEIWQRRQP